MTARLVDPFLNEEDYPSTNEFLRNNDPFSVYRSHFSKNRYDLYLFSELKNAIPDSFTTQMLLHNTGFLCYVCEAIENIWELYNDAITEENEEGKFRKTIVLLSALEERTIITASGRNGNFFAKFNNEEMSYGELLDMLSKIKDFAFENGGEHFYERPSNVLLSVGCYKVQNGFGGARTVRVGKFYPCVCGNWRNYMKRRHLPPGDDAESVVVNPFKMTYYEMEWCRVEDAVGAEKTKEFQELVEGLNCKRFRCTKSARN